jgi:hypothetical protein
LSSTCRDEFIWYFWLFIILFFLSLSPKCHKLIPLLQTCSTYECVHDHISFCVYLYALDLFSMYWGQSPGTNNKMKPFCVRGRKTQIEILLWPWCLRELQSLKRNINLMEEKTSQ